MTLEELKAAFEEFKVTAKEALDAQATEIGALKAKNAEIITEKRTLRDELNALKAGKKPADDEDKSGKGVRARVDAEYAERLKALEDQNAALARERNDAMVSTALDDALQTVAPAMRGVVKNHLKASRKIEVADGAVLCDGQAVKESVGAWLATPEGKAFIPAPPNGGSAAPGGTGGSVTKPRSKMNSAEKGAYIRLHGLDEYNRLPA